LSVEEKVLMAGYKKDGSSTRLEVLQVTPLNSSIDAELLRRESVVVYLYCNQTRLQ
jgi:hypothetical protein